jgi:serine/threonine protein kinase
MIMNSTARFRRARQRCNAGVSWNRRRYKGGTILAGQQAASAKTTVAHYRILEKLGVGGKGVVYKAQDTTGLSVAPGSCPRASHDHVALERSARGAVASVDHPHLHHLRNRRRRGPPFIAMQYLAGQTLKCRIEKPLNTETLLILRFRLSMA